jgi:FkbM family methyltransferase
MILRGGLTDLRAAVKLARIHRAMWSLRLGRCGPVARALASALRRLLPVRGIGPLTNIVLGAPRHSAPSPALAATGGVTFELDLREALHRMVFLDLFSIELRRVVLPLLRPGDLVVDVGANFGFWSVLAARRGCNVIAVEPIARTRALLERNLERNGLTAQVEIVVQALSDAPGSLTIAVPDGESGQAGSYPDAGSSLEPETVPTTTLDALIGDRRIRFLKIDVEGHEWAVLRGASSLLSNGRVDHVLVEISSVVLTRAGRSVAELVGLLTAHGYEFARFVVANEGLAPRDSYGRVALSDLLLGAHAGDALFSRAGPPPAA